jgi:hypothetical protein
MHARAILLLFVATCPTWAGVVSRDLLEPGDGLLTYDDSNHREWLDFSVAANLNMNEMYAQTAAGGSLAGFHLATGLNLEELGRSSLTQASDWREEIHSLLPYQQLGLMASDIAERRYYVDEMSTSSLHVFLGPSLGGMAEIKPNLVFVWARHSFGYSGFYDASLDFMAFPWPGVTPAYWLFRETTFFPNPPPQPSHSRRALPLCAFAPSREAFPQTA